MRQTGKRQPVSKISLSLARSRLKHILHTPPWTLQFSVSIIIYSLGISMTKALCYVHWRCQGEADTDPALKDFPSDTNMCLGCLI